MTADKHLKLKIVTKMVRQPIVGGRKVTVDTAKSWVAKHDRGRAETLIRNMITDPSAPIEAYGGGSRDNIRLSSMQAGIDYIKDNGGTLPFGVTDDD